MPMYFANNQFLHQLETNIKPVVMFSVSDMLTSMNREQHRIFLVDASDNCSSEG